MYISRIKILPDSDFLGFLQKNNTIYDVHQFLWNIFPNDPDKDRDFIYREEKNDDLPTFYIVSKRKPLEMQRGFQIDTKKYDPQISEGDIFSFTLRANPTVAKKVDGKKNSTNHDISMVAKKEAQNKGLQDEEKYNFIEEATKNWLSENKANTLGFKLSNSNISVDAYMQNRVYRKKEGKPILFSSVDYSGLLEVTDPKLFKNLLFNGIGKSKAFGCGLMLIRRV